MWQFFSFKLFLFFLILNIVPVLFFAADFNSFNCVFVSLTLEFYNLQSLTKLLHFLEKILIPFLWIFRKLLRQTYFLFHQYLRHYIDCLLFLIVQPILFAELLLDLRITLFIYLNQLLIIYNKFWYNNKLINIQ